MGNRTALDALGKLTDSLAHDEPDGTFLSYMQKLPRPLIGFAACAWVLSVVYMMIRAAHGYDVSWPPSHVSGALVAIVVVGILGRQWGKNKEIEVRHAAFDDVLDSEDKDTL